MDLAAVKASVKAWEKRFKAENKRDPTKEDIKADPSGIAEQYSLYRRLSKSLSASSQASQSQTQARPNINGASQRASSSTSTSQSSRVTPRTVAASEYPTTPTPPTRRSSGRIPQSEAEEEDHHVGLQAGPSTTTAMGAPGQSKSLKRTASKAALNPRDQPISPASKLLTTPKKRPYTGPIHDPNPINPFAASPLRRSAMKSTEPHLGPDAGPSSSPFLYASSPKKLKELVQETSARRLHKNSPAKEVTPRTKARKRLTGEMDETPAKSRVRRKRGAGSTANTGHDARSGRMNGPEPGVLGRSVRDGSAASLETEEEENEREDEFGPTPIKSTRQQESFHSLFDQEDAARTAGSGVQAAKVNGGSDNMVGRLLAARDKGKQKAEEVVSISLSANDGGLVASSPDPNDETPLEGSTDPPSLDSEQAESGIPPWIDNEEEEALRRESSISNRPSPARPEKTLTISDDEIDEWDPEASHVRHRVKIVPTRSRPVKQRWSEEDDDFGNLQQEVEAGDHAEDNEAGAVDTETPPTLDDATTSQTKTTITSPPPLLLSLLSLTSPNHRQSRHARLKELRYKALFNPSGADARKLKAFQKGQEAFVSGETEADDENVEFEGIENVDEGEGDAVDDDWESESEGWKRLGVEMDDDMW